MFLKFVAAVLWVIFMTLTGCIVVRNGMAMEGWDGTLSIGIGIGCSLLASFGSIATFSVWERRKGAARGAAGVALAALCWIAGEAAVIYNELSWRSAAIEDKSDAKDDADTLKEGAKKRFKKAQGDLAALPNVRGVSAIDADERTALAEGVTWKQERTTLGAVTKKCTDTGHDLYRRCAAVLRFRAERETSISTMADRERLDAIVQRGETALSAKREGGDVAAASRWLAARSGHTRQAWETVGTIIMLLVFALGRDAPGCVVSSLRDDKPEDRAPSIKLTRVEFHRVVVWERLPEPCVLSIARVRLPAIEQAPSRGAPIEISDDEVEEILSLPAPMAVRDSKPEVVEEPKEELKSKAGRKASEPRKVLPKNVTLLHHVDRRPGWEARDWLRETLADGPMSRQEVLALAAQKGLNRGAVDRAADAIPVIKIPAAEGKRGVSWGLKSKPRRKSSQTEI
jgi:hypothetical protein